jgi:hypothetical protein
VFINIRKSPTGGRFHLTIQQFGETESTPFSSFIVDSNSHNKIRSTINLGNFHLNPLDWQSRPLASTICEFQLISHPDKRHQQTIHIDSIELIKIR